MKVLDFAYDIIEMQNRIDDLESQVTSLTWYKEEFHKLVRSTEDHSRHMMAGLLELCLTPGVSEALDKNHKSVDSDAN